MHVPPLLPLVTLIPGTTERLDGGGRSVLANVGVNGRRFVRIWFQLARTRRRWSCVVTGDSIPESEVALVPHFGHLTLETPCLEPFRVSLAGWGLLASRRGAESPLLNPQPDATPPPRGAPH